MTKENAPPAPQGAYDLLLVGQRGRVGLEALLCLASLRAHDPGFAGTVYVAEPQPGPLWPEDPRLSAKVKGALSDLGAEILPFESRHFGAIYPQGNKIEALSALPEERPFLFLDSDMLVTGALSEVAFDPSVPAASLQVSDSWPKPPAYGPDRSAIWASLYRRFGLDMGPTLDPSFPPDHPHHFLYCNAGWFCGPSGPRFGARFAEIACAIRDDPPAELAMQALTPWLDQIALPLVLTEFGGGRAGPRLDGEVLFHYRTLPLLYASAPDPVVEQLTALADRPWLKKHLKTHTPFHKALYRGEGLAARRLFDRARLPPSEMVIRKTLRKAGLWRR